MRTAPAYQPNKADQPAVFHRQVTAAGLLIATGIVFGDIGTSPLYTYSAVFRQGEIIQADKALGVLSAVTWTLILLTTVKYIWIVLQADNKGEGGIFSLYALVRRYSGYWLVLPAIAGAAFLMADGIITPPISVASAVEGLQKFRPQLNAVPWVLLILVSLFLLQQTGTGRIGRVFGPVMLCWFGFIGVLGGLSLWHNPSVLRALNPWYAYRLLHAYPGGFWLLGGIFLCSTGAEALYSDMGHVGRNHIRWSWMFIQICLLLSYGGQTAWLVAHQGQRLGHISPFYSTVPASVYLFAVGLATAATIIASQALISGCFTLVNEGIRLGLWPKHRVRYPSDIQGQVYIPAINWLLMAACCGMVLYFRKSTNMEAAFGLSVTLTMLATSFLTLFYFRVRRQPRWKPWVFGTVFLTLEGLFLVANLAKLLHGGWITLLIGLLLSFMMYVWYYGDRTHRRFLRYVPLAEQVPLLLGLDRDPSIPYYVTHLVCLSSADNDNLVEERSVLSIVRSPVKKADFYWFVHLVVTDEPYTREYRVRSLVSNEVYHVVFRLGFRIDPRIDLMFRQVVADLKASGELQDRHGGSRYNLDPRSDYLFLLGDSYLSADNELSQVSYFLLRAYYNLRSLSVKKQASFGLELSNVYLEKYPVVIKPWSQLWLKRQNR